jgi:hypothetical protein
MKTLIKSAILIIVFINMYSCGGGRPISKTKPKNNSTYQVEYLFEHDGCKVYRFWDYKNYVYFTNCNGEVTSIENDSIQTRVVNVNRNKVSK